MKVPLEILRIILEWAVVDCHLRDAFALRLVNSLFRDEVDAALVDLEKVRRAFFIKNNDFRSLAPSLQRHYLRFLAKTHHKNPTIFSSLFHRVLRIRLHLLGRSVSAANRLYVHTKISDASVTADREGQIFDDLLANVDLDLFGNRFSDNHKVLVAQGDSHRYWLKVYDEYGFQEYEGLNETIRTYLFVRLLHGEGRHSSFGYYVRVRQHLDKPVPEKDLMRFAHDLCWCAVKESDWRAAVSVVHSKLGEALPDDEIEQFLERAHQDRALSEASSVFFKYYIKKHSNMQPHCSEQTDFMSAVKVTLDVGDKAAFQYLLKELRKMRSQEELRWFHFQLWGFKTPSYTKTNSRESSQFGYKQLDKLRAMGNIDPLRSTVEYDLNPAN